MSSSYLNLSSFRKKLRAYLQGDDHAIKTFTLSRILQTEIWLSVFFQRRRARIGVRRGIGLMSRPRRHNPRRPNSNSRCAVADEPASELKSIDRADIGAMAGNG